MAKKNKANDEQPRGSLVKGRVMFMVETGPITDELQEDINRAQTEGYVIHSVSSTQTHSGLATVVIASKPAPEQQERTGLQAHDTEEV